MPAAKYRYKTRLHALIAKGPVPSRRAWQDSILTYLTQNCSVSAEEFEKQEKKTFFASPLPVNVVPKKSLVDELRTEENGLIPIHLAVEHNCPSDIVAALCHLFPQGATVPNEDGALPLHIASRYPTGSANKKKPDPVVSDNLKAIGVLCDAYPMALVTRDSKGRTPLHVLLENHGTTRHAELIERFSRNVDEKVWRYEVESDINEDEEVVPLPIPTVVKKKMLEKEEQERSFFCPASALAIPDKVHGAIPLHYAVSNAAPKEVVAALVKGFPASVVAVDCNGRTPLHWCFGAMEDGVVKSATGKTPIHHFHRSSHIVTLLLKQDAGLYNPAEVKDTYKRSGRPHRNALHYAIELLVKNILDPAPAKEGEKSPSSCITLKTLQAVIRSNRDALVEKDAFGQTPLHCLFRLVFERNTEEYVKALHISQTGAANVGQPVESKTFSPPSVVVGLLMEPVEEDGLSAISVGDIRGLLPLHCAVLAAASINVLKKLIEANPKSLTQLTRDVSSIDVKFIREHYDYVVLDDPLFVSSFASSRTPMHMAFASPYVSKIHSKETIENLLSYESAGDDNEDDETTDTQRRRVKIDASIALKMQDGNGDTPLHLAAKNFLSLDMLKFILQKDPEVAMIANNLGNLPLHFLLDSNFLFVNSNLAIAHGNKDKNQENPDETSAEFRDKVRDLAKKQAIVTRLAKYNLCGAIFAPANGWTSDDDESAMDSTYDVMKKINLLAMAIVDHVPSLLATDSVYGLNCLHILLAFHATPYAVIRQIIERCPDCAHQESIHDGHTPLDLHLLRRTIPNEVRKDEMDSWKSIKELVFLLSSFPIENLNEKTSGGLYNCRHDQDMISSLEQQILAELSGEHTLSYHWEGNYPIDPIHFKLGLLKCVEDVSFAAPEDYHLSPISTRAWSLFVMYYNLSDPCDNFSSSVEKILEHMSFDEIMQLRKYKVTFDAFRNIRAIQVADSNETIFTVDQYAHVYCKAIFHKNQYFGGMYDFTPPYNQTITLHRSANKRNILIRATRKKLQYNEKKGENGQPWMFDPSEDVTLRNDHYFDEASVVFKFTTNQWTYEREMKWRKELTEDEFPSIIPILSTFDPRCIDGVPDKKYETDRLDKRFKDMPLRGVSASALDDDEKLTIADYPYAVVFPFSSDGTLKDLFSHGFVDKDMIRECALDMASVLDKMHQTGLIHGSFTMENIISFPNEGKEGPLRLMKVGGLTSMTPKEEKIKLGAIAQGGKCLFESACLPPEMFVKLNENEVQMYNKYWKEVMKLEAVSIPYDLVKPRVDPITRDTYVIKYYCFNLAEETKKSLPPLPYELVDFDEALDTWSFGVFLFSLTSGGGTLGQITPIQMLATWNPDVVESIVSQHVKDLVTQDLLLHLLAPREQRKVIDMHSALSHPFFSSGPLSIEAETILKEIKEERDLMSKIRERQLQGDQKLDDVGKETISLARVSLKTQMSLTNSATEMLRESFDPSDTYTRDFPFSHVLLPYKLAINKDGKLTPGTKMDVELAERIGRQTLMLCKVLCFAACYKETLSSRNKIFEELVFNIFLKPDMDPTEAANEILATFHLDSEYYEGICAKFLLLVKAEIQQDRKTFAKNPMAPILKLVSKYVSTIADNYTMANKAYLYLVDEFSGVPALLQDSKIYPHVFREHVVDLVYKSIPYMHACISSAICGAEGVKGLVKLIFEGAYPQSPPSWHEAFKGIPTIPSRKRMVTECRILHQACHLTIPHDSPVALNGEPELQFFSSLFIHIDSMRSYSGLRPVTDSKATMWVAEKSRKQLIEESQRESNPDRVHELFMKEKEKETELVDTSVNDEKERRIEQLEKALRKVTKEAEMLRASNFEDREI